MKMNTNLGDCIHSRRERRVLLNRDAILVEDDGFTVDVVIVDVSKDNFRLRSVALLNAHALLGFPPSMQGARVTVRLRHPPGWTVETALPGGREGYRADSYDHLVDSPFLLGDSLTTANGKTAPGG